MNNLLNEYFRLNFELNIELSHFLARFNVKINNQNVSVTPNPMELPRVPEKSQFLKLQGREKCSHLM